MSSERRLFPLRLRGRIVHPPPLSPRPESPHNAAVLRLHSSGARTTVGHSGGGIVRSWNGQGGRAKHDSTNDSSDEYAPRLSSRTGGFEGLTTEVDSGIYSSSVDNDDACTLPMANNTIQTVPAWPTTTTTTRLRLDPNFPHHGTAAPLEQRRHRRFLTPRMFHSSSKAAAAASTSASSNGGLYSAETAVAMNTTYKPSTDLANNNNSNNNKSVGTRSVLFGRKRSSISNNSNSKDITPHSSNNTQQQGLVVPPKSPVPPRPTPTSFSGAAAAVPPRQSFSSSKKPPGGTRFRLPDEPQRAKQQQQRLPHPDSPVTFDHTDAAVVLGSTPSVSSGAAPVVPTITATTVGPPPQLVRLPSVPRSTTEQGFELSLSGHVVQDQSRALLVRPVALPTPLPILRHKSSNNNKNNTTIPVDVDTATPVHVEDSPGTVRLTEDKLQRHEQRQSLPQFCRDHALLEGESNLLVRAASDRRHDRGANNNNKMNNNKSNIPLVKNASSFLRRRPPPEDVADFSLAPLHTMKEDIVTAAARDPAVVLRRVRSRSGNGKLEKQEVCRTSVVESLFRKLPFSRRTSSYNDKAAVILERERQAAWESQQAYWEAQERKRIERKHRDYDLERQRSPELCVMTSAQRAAVFAGMELVEQDRIVTQQQQKQEQQQLPQYQPPTDQHTQSTSCSTLTLGPTAAVAVPMFPACVVCRQEQRTHIATPCMHLAYCANCARALRREKSGCAVCALQDVKFAAVSF